MVNLRWDLPHVPPIATPMRSTKKEAGAAIAPASVSVQLGGELHGGRKT